MDIHKNGGVKLPSSSAKTNGKPTAMMGLRSSWLIEGSSDWTAVTHANGGQLKAAEDQKRSALEDGLKRRTTAAGKGDNVNDNSSADNVSDGDHCQTKKKNWSADDDKHDAKSDTCLPTTTSTTTRSHLGQVWLMIVPHLSFLVAKDNVTSVDWHLTTTIDWWSLLFAWRQHFSFLPFEFILGWTRNAGANKKSDSLFPPRFQIAVVSCAVFSVCYCQRVGCSESESVQTQSAGGRQRWLFRCRMTGTRTAATATKQWQKQTSAGLCASQCEEDTHTHTALNIFFDDPNSNESNSSNGGGKWPLPPPTPQVAV